MSQVAADALGLPVGKVRTELGDTDLPSAPGSMGSMTAASVVPAVKRAAGALRDTGIRMAVADEDSPLHRVPEDDVLVRNGRLFKRGDPARGERYTRLLRRNKRSSVDAAAEFEPREEEKVTCRAFSADFAEVRVDPELGTVRVTRHVKAVEAGRIINPRTARSRIIGGVVFGIGQALTEVSEVDRRDARVANSSLWGYHVPVNADVPDIDVIFVEKEDEHVPEGVKGLGELAAIGTAPAIANAVFHATGTRIRSLPVTADKLL